MTKRLLVVTDNYVGEPGGSEKHLLNLLSGIGNDFEVTVFQMYPDKIRDTIKDGKLRKKNNVTLFSTPVNSVFSFSYLFLILEVFFLIRKSNIDLIISYHEKSDLLNYIVKKLSFKRLVNLSSKRDMGFNTSSRLKKLMKFITKRLDGIVSPSSSIKDLMINEYGVSADKAWVIHNGTDLDLYRQGTAQDILNVRENLKLPLNKKIICCVGTLKPIKGHAFLLEGFARYLEKSKDTAMLVLIGGGDEEVSLKSLAKQLGIEDKVIFAGWQKNVSEWMKVVDLFVISSLSEGLSNALVEASAAGLPLLATDVGGNGEVVVNNDNGLLVQASSSMAIADAFESLLTNSERLKSFGHRSRELAEQKFSNAAMVGSFETLFSKKIEDVRLSD
ncbi:MAG: glycosyltransferase [Cellvibrionaceae bacterium]